MRTMATPHGLRHRTISSEPPATPADGQLPDLHILQVEVVDVAAASSSTSSAGSCRQRYGWGRARADVQVNEAAQPDRTGQVAPGGTTTRPPRCGAHVVIARSNAREQSVDPWPPHRSR